MLAPNSPTFATYSLEANRALQELGALDCMATQPHVLAVPLPAQGHLNPLMRICKTLASHGFIITFVNIDPIHDRIVPCLPHTQGAAQERKLLDIRRAHVPIAGFDMAKDFRFSLENLYHATEGLTDAIVQLVERLNNNGSPVTCLMSDVFMSSPTQRVADKFHIPRIAVFTSSQSFNMFCFHLLSGQISMKDALDVLLQTDKQADLFKEALPGLPAALCNGDLPNFKHVVDDNAFMYPLITRQCEIAFKKSHAIVLNSFEELEGPAFHAMRKSSNQPIYGVGPLIEELVDESSTSLWKEEDAALDWLAHQPPQSVLYVSFGSFTLLPELQFQEVLCGFEASNQKILWAFRPDLVEGAPNGFISSDFMEKTKDRSCIVSWAPQMSVLSHPAVGGFLTHCGWNSTIEGVASGVPMLCWPYFADQFLDAKYVVEEWKVGLRFEKGMDGMVGREEVEKKVRALMEGEEGNVVRKNAALLKVVATRSLQVGGSSHNNIHNLIQSLSLPHSKLKENFH